MQNRREKRKPEDTTTGADTPATETNKKLKVAGESVPEKEDHKGAIIKTMPAMAGQSTMIDGKKESKADGSFLGTLKKTFKCWECQESCSPMLGFCFQCVRHVAPDLLEKFPRGRLTIESDEQEHEEQPDESGVVQVPPPSPAQDFFSRIISGIHGMVGRTVYFKIDGKTDVFIRPSQADANILAGYVQRIRQHVSKSGMQLEAMVERCIDRDRFSWCYRWPFTPEDREVCSLTRRFKGTCLGFFFDVDQDNGLEQLHPLGFGTVMLRCWEPLFEPPMHLRVEGEFKVAYVFTACAKRMVAYTHDVRAIKKASDEAFLASMASQPWDDETATEAKVPEMHKACFTERHELQRAFMDHLAPILEFCVYASLPRTMPQLLGDVLDGVPRQNMTSDAKVQIYDMSA